mmetsp:Transcript_5244/g.19099  ORF Transcript_5244/g.19099 Transcript_5244/m.19099 type:complete len:204 (+) Transcript_5244:2227-2838(+)
MRISSLSLFIDVRNVTDGVSVAELIDVRRPASAIKRSFTSLDVAHVDVVSSSDNRSAYASTLAFCTASLVGGENDDVFDPALTVASSSTSSSSSSSSATDGIGSVSRVVGSSSSSASPPDAASRASRTASVVRYTSRATSPAPSSRLARAIVTDTASFARTVVPKRDVPNVMHATTSARATRRARRRRGGARTLDAPTPATRS